MLTLSGDGVLALWNGIDPARREEYDLWHTREHVPERVAVPGMLGARRYVRTEGTLPDYLTLYDLRDTAVLGSPAYLQLLENPSEWSRSMRPSFRGFMRICCRRIWSTGGGAGGALGAAVFDRNAIPAQEGLRAALAELVHTPPVVAMHLLIRDETVADVPFTIGGPAPDFPRSAVILLESWDQTRLAETGAVMGERLAALGAGAAAATFTCYRMAYALDRASLDQLVVFPRRASPV